MRYHVISSTTLEDLVSQTNEFLELDWKPVGGIAISKLEDDSLTDEIMLFYQAVARAGGPMDPSNPYGS